MTPEQWEKVSEIFHEASELDGDERIRYLDSQCDGDDSLRREVESLLAANSKAGSFISEPVAGAFASRLLKGAAFAAGEMLGHYRIIAKIGSGGMGEVYLAADTKLGRNVALKTLSPIFQDDDDFLRRFRNEARAAAALNHPHVATVYSVEEANGHTFIAMEYIEGKTLQDLIPEGGVDVETFVAWFVPVALALEHAHSRGVIHRDIKPGNIMLTNDGIVKILDFGLAYFGPPVGRDVDPLVNDVTQPGQILGTPAYMSPEQAEGKEVDHRSDIFSLGVVMYEAITGRKPFRGDSNAEVITNLTKIHPPPACDVKSDVPQPISQLIDRCLQKRSRARFQSMQEVRALLRAAGAERTSVSSTGSFGRRLYLESKSVGWRRRIVSALGVAALGVGGWFFFSGESRPPIDFDRMTMRRLSDTNNVGYAQISPDGKSIAFATFEDDGSRALWFRRIDDRNALQIVPPERIQYWGGLTISEDGGHVYYITAQRTATHGTLYRVSSLGGPPRKLVAQANDVGGLSPDGSRLLFARYSDPCRIISVASDDGSDEQLVYEVAGTSSLSTHFRDPKFSSDGKSVFFIRSDNIDGVENWSVEQVETGDRSVRSIYKQRARISELAVLRNSEGLLMTATDPETNLQQLYYLSPAGKKTRVTNDLYAYFGVSVDRDGRNIVVSQRSDQQRLWVGDSSDLTKLKALNSEPRANRTVEWTLDGRIVFDGFENNISDIWIADADGRNLQKLTDSDGDDADPKISGDGRFIVFTSRRSGRNQVWRMELDGSGQVLLADVSGITQRPRFAADGRTVIFEWIRDGERILGAVGVDGGAVYELQRIDDIPRDQVFFWAASPDGTRTASSIWDNVDKRMKVAIRTVDGSEVLRVLDIWPAMILEWGRDSATLYYRERQSGDAPENEVRMIDTVTGKSSVVLSTTPEYVTDLTHSHDGKRVAIVRGRNTSNAVILTLSDKQ